MDLHVDVLPDAQRAALIETATVAAKESFYLALAYFDDAERQRMPSMIRKVPWKTIKAEVQRWISEMEVRVSPLSLSARGE